MSDTFSAALFNPQQVQQPQVTNDTMIQLKKSGTAVTPGGETVDILVDAGGPTTVTSLENQLANLNAQVADITGMLAAARAIVAAANPTVQS